jgi:hypothetical protein
MLRNFFPLSGASNINFQRKINFLILKQSIFFSTINKEHYKNNKDFASKFRDLKPFDAIYNLNLQTLIHSMFLIRKNFDVVIFLGMNPDVYLAKKPPGKKKIIFYDKKFI